MKNKSINLKGYNTFGVQSLAQNFYTINTESCLKDVLYDCHRKGLKIRVLGGGSNILFTKDIDDAILYNCIQGIKIVDEGSEYVVLEAGSGVGWHEFVTHCVQNHYQGLENLALIPGTVGAAPVQNIGAYGVEQKSTFLSLDAVNLNNGKMEIFDLSSSGFNYRDSVFKSKLKGEYYITKVRYRLKKFNYASNYTYSALKEKLKVNKGNSATINEVYNAVIELRQSKLPNPECIGNAGSFFKNPIILTEHYNVITRKYGEFPCYTVDNARVKIPAACLIEERGWKGYRKKDVGVHKKQALVIVNYGGGTAKEILVLAEKIQESILSKYDIHLEPEINIW